jgi:hypothetical protein
MHRENGRVSDQKESDHMHSILFHFSCIVSATHIVAKKFGVDGLCMVEIWQGE